MSNSKCEIKVCRALDAPSLNVLLELISGECARTETAHKANLDAATILAALKKRENESSTVMGCGMMFPHARFKNLESLCVVFCTLAKPVRENGTDTVCALLVPSESPMDALKVISRVATCAKDGECRNHLRESLDSGALQKIRALVLPDEQRTLSAADLMQDAQCVLSPEMPLAKATRLMHSAGVQTAPVLDSEGRLIGEIACTELFKLGIPEFFTQLKSVGFIRYFDPFEKYFKLESESLVQDVMTRDVPQFSTDSTLIEAVFAMSVKKYPLLYVTDNDSHLLGVVSQGVLLERVINM